MPQVSKSRVVAAEGVALVAVHSRLVLDEVRLERVDEGGKFLQRGLVGTVLVDHAIECAAVLAFLDAIARAGDIEAGDPFIVVNELVGFQSDGSSEPRVRFNVAASNRAAVGR